MNQEPSRLKRAFGWSPHHIIILHHMFFWHAKEQLQSPEEGTRKIDTGKSGKVKPNHHKYVNPQETLIENREYSMSNPSHFIKQPIWVRKQI